MNPLNRLMCVGALALPSLACSSKADPTGAHVDGAGPLYVVAPWVVGDDDSIAYVTAVPSLSEGEVDLGSAHEYSGGASVFGRGGEDEFFVAPYSEPIVERWHVRPDGSFEARGAVSFLNLGIADAGGTQLFSQGKAYFLGSREIVIWDPAEMQLIGTVPLPSLDETEAGTFEPSAGLVALSDDSLMVYLHWSDPDDWTRWADHSTHVIFDTRTDSVVTSFDEPRCEMLEPFGIKTSDAKTYFSSDPSYQLLERAYGSDHGTRSCGLRALNAAGSFDPKFFVDPSELVGGRPAGTVTMVTDELAFIDVFHTELLDEPITPETVDAASSSPAYRFWTWRVGDTEAQDAVEQQPRTSSSLWQYVSDEGAVFVQDHDAEYSRWKLLELRSDGSVVDGLSGVGYATSGIVRVR